MNALHKMYWNCDVCGEKRPDYLIGVISETRVLKVGKMGIGGTVSRNVKYCKDQRECKARARRIALEDIKELSGVSIGEESNIQKTQ